MVQDEEYPLLELAFEEMVISYASLLIMCKREAEAITMLKKVLTSCKMLSFSRAKTKVNLMIISLEIKLKTENSSDLKHMLK